MSFSSANGYVPVSIETIMSSVMDNVNTQFGTAYTAETFIGTNFYKFYYALVQRLQENEVKTSEIFAKIQDYLAITNERISRPVVTNPGLIEKLEAAGYTASVKKPVDADAGKIYIAVDTDETDPAYATTKLAINTIIKDSTVAGAVTQGTEASSITLTNGQSFDFKYNLPNRITVLLKLTLTLSANNQNVVGDPDDVKLLLLANVLERYALGKNFEPMKYFEQSDAPWASTVLLEWSSNGGSSWNSTVYSASYNDKFVVTLANISLVEV
jgi:hypothetical protein